MNLKIILIFFTVCLNVQTIKAQDFKQQFRTAFQKQDTTEQKNILDKWSQENDNDPELYVAYFNYFATQSKKEMITLGQNPKGENVLQIMDKDTSETEPVGFIYGETYYDTDLLTTAFQYINKGIENYPNRLDMRFGYIYMLGESEDYDLFTTEIIKTIDYSAINKNQWTWSDGKPLESPKETMLGSIQGYQLTLYNTEEDKLLENMKNIAQAVLKHYPNHIESLSNLSVVFLIQGEYDKALEPLLKANKLTPNDTIVLNNIAQTYKLKGDKKNALKYYKMIVKQGDEEAKEHAKQQIEALTENE